MDAERDREGFKHVCKLCNKRYPSGKSLGGHMRSHVMANSRKNKLAQMNKAPTFVADDDDEQERENGSGQSGYGLRENPKKTWRVVDSRITNKFQQQDRICKQCGKGFQSLKALCGHMSSHSEKDRNFKVEDDHSWSSESHSSSNSEIDQHEQEEVAMSLMMLSRDSSSSPCFNLDSSDDNNSVILDYDKSTIKIKINNKVNNVHQDLDNSDSGYFENGAKELESDDSNDGFHEFKNPKLDSGSGLVNSNSKKRSSSTGRDVGIFQFDIPLKMKQKRSKLETTHDAKKGSGTKGGHKCPYCPKVFKSGQALGGHKRSHMMGGGGGGIATGGWAPPPRPPEPEQKQPMIDLNLPAPVEEEVGGFL